jgi:cytosine deaminase
MDLIIRNAKIEDFNRPQDIGIKDGVIKEISEHLPTFPRSKEIDARSRLVIPGFVDAHVHLDKAMTIAPGAIKNESFIERIDHINELKKTFQKESVLARVMALVNLFAQKGILTLRANVDVDPTVGLTGIEGVLEARKRCADIVNIQVIAFAQEGIIRYPQVKSLLEEALKMGADGVGGHTSIEPEGKKHIDTIFKIGKNYAVDIDFHVDENADPDYSLMEYVVSKATSEKYGQHVNAIHCSALAGMDPRRQNTLIEKTSDAGVNITVCPGVIAIDCPLAPVIRMIENGINVSMGSDNFRDPINPLGTGDPLILSVMLCHLQKIFGKEELTSVFKAITVNGAKTLNLGRRYGIKTGNAADLVILDSCTQEEVILGAPRRVEIIKNGKNILDLTKH